MLTSGDVLAGNEYIHRELLHLIAQAGKKAAPATA
jgi:hypothetical protein